MTPMQRLEAARAIVQGLPGDARDQLTVAMLAMTMAMRLAAGANEQLYAQLVDGAIRLMHEAPPFDPQIEHDQINTH